MLNIEEAGLSIVYLPISSLRASKNRRRDLEAYLRRLTRRESAERKKRKG